MSTSGWPERLSAQTQSAASTTARARSGRASSASSSPRTCAWLAASSSADEPAREQHGAEPVDAGRARAPATRGRRRSSRPSRSCVTTAGSRRASGRRGLSGSARRARSRARRRCRACRTSSAIAPATRSRRELVADDPEREREDRAAETLDHARDDHQRERADDRRQQRLPAARPRSAITSTRFLPKMSPSRPAIGVTTEAASRYEVKIQATPDGEACQVVAAAR